ncbi:MAG TPA: transposase [Rubricoccaceae bacterium]|nr:transposase [Rubricoccaceae bacterium]
MPRITYSDDFKREAVRLVTDEGHSRKQVARDLGVSLGALRDWIHRFAPGGGAVSDALPEAEQIRQLRRELRRVEMERDILKKAVGIFSQMPPKS